MPFSIYKLTQDWNEAGVTWFKTGMTATETWQTAGGKYNTTKLATITPASNQANTWVNLKVTSALKEFYATPASNFGFIVRFDQDVADQHDYRSSEYTTDVTQRPKLTVYFTQQNSIKQNLFGTIKPAKEYKVTVYTLQGKKIAFFETKNISSLNKLLPTGVTIVKINGQKMKFVKQK